MATHILDSRKAVRTYLHLQWTTMFNTLGNLESKDANTKKIAKENFQAFEEAISFPYNQKLAYFPVDQSLDSVEPTGRARGEFGKGSLVPTRVIPTLVDPTPEGPTFEEVGAHQSAMLASLYARQEFIRAAARMPMTLFVGPSPTNSAPKYPPKGILLTSEKFSRVVFSGFRIGGFASEYVAVAELSRTYPQSAVVRVVWMIKEGSKVTSDRITIQDVEKRWKEIAGANENTTNRILFQRGKFKKRVIPLLTVGLHNTETKKMYIQKVDTTADMWANVIALTASDKHGDTNLLEKDAEKLWGSPGTTNYLKGWQWMAAMLALRRIPYIVKSEEVKDANKDSLPHALTHEEAKTVKDMMGAIIEARRGGGNKKKSSSINSKLSRQHQKKRVIFAETAKWW